MFTEASNVAFLLLVVTCTGMAVQQVRVTSNAASAAMAPDRSNKGCNGVTGQTNGPFTCTSGFACVNIGYVIRHACQSCSQNGLMSASEEAECRTIAQGGQTIKGVKVYCADQYVRDGCVYPEVGPTGWTNLGSSGATKVCPCVKGYVRECKNRGLSCVLDKIDVCPNVCRGIKGRIIDSRAHSASSSLVEDALKNRSSVLVDSHGRTSRNASASMMSLDHTTSGKCAE